jgi:hypothetical protein
MPVVSPDDLSFCGLASTFKLLSSNHTETTNVMQGHLPACGLLTMIELIKNLYLADFVLYGLIFNYGVAKIVSEIPRLCPWVSYY